ncbi:MAG: alanyl-tRNA editing protein, partial [Chloroflexi bacterium]|nr:alanyl-tRNA editing protein [Chloroflexota bacterium]
DEVILHVMEAPLEHGDAQGEVGWTRRFDHMQQHSGQHLLSAAFERVWDLDTVGFHLGSETSTIDVAAARFSRENLAPVEDLVNQVIWENRSVTARFIGDDELHTLPLRRAPSVAGPVRIIEVAGFDLNPCGGTHVAHTGEIGLVKVLRLDYRNDVTRVEFVCGGRALNDYRRKHAVIGEIAGRLMVGYAELDSAVERLQNECKQLHRELRLATDRLIDMEADVLTATAAGSGAFTVIERVWEQRAAAEVRAMAQALARRGNAVALLATVGDRTDICFSASDSVDINVAHWLREACAQLGGKGGGQSHMAHGSAPTSDLQQVETVLRDVALRIR